MILRPRIADCSHRIAYDRRMASELQMRFFSSTSFAHEFCSSSSLKAGMPSSSNMSMAAPFGSNRASARSADRLYDAFRKLPAIPRLRRRSLDNQMIEWVKDGVTSCHSPTKAPLPPKRDTRHSASVVRRRCPQAAFLVQFSHATRR